jgi:hypothetical protein
MGGDRLLASLGLRKLRPGLGDWRADFNRLVCLRAVGSPIVMGWLDFF